LIDRNNNTPLWRGVHLCHIKKQPAFLGFKKEKAKLVVFGD
jgi:hypothetical protein